MLKEQKIRVVLFYTAVLVFIIGLPLILSSSLGYKFNPRTFKFTKTGIIGIKTEPEGAAIYCDGKLLKDKSPASIRELLPGKYNISIELQDHYPWRGDVNVSAGQVARLENIILFSVRPNIRQINKEKVTSFWVDVEKTKIYYFDAKENIIYTSDLKGENFQDVGMFSEIVPVPKKWKVSPDRKRAVFFNPNQIVVSDMGQEEGRALPDTAVILNFANRKLVDVFWHSDSFHLIVVTDRSIEVIETRPDAVAINLVDLVRKNTPCFYNEKEDALYFLDTEESPGAKPFDNLYKLDLNIKSSPFLNLTKPKSDE
ncbi:MAG: PEGA domain-containing protein [Candidatus Omnitrophica bacterium]|nr:PEGA domain-containing protein [Candidatus Omnitrophota bacterium]